jgi:hypothetical protein
VYVALTWRGAPQLQALNFEGAEVREVSQFARQKFELVFLDLDREMWEVGEEALSY